jgi:hypothetical protein
MSSMPTTPFSGVRTSWLTVAANCAFICAMLTAASRDSFSSASRCSSTFIILLKASAISIRSRGPAGAARMPDSPDSARRIKVRQCVERLDHVAREQAAPAASRTTANDRVRPRLPSKSDRVRRSSACPCRPMHARSRAAAAWPLAGRRARRRRGRCRPGPRSARRRRFSPARTACASGACRRSCRR